MNNKILVYVTALLLSLNSFSEEILLKNATIHTATNQGSLENSDILIRDGYIVRIGENISSSSAIVVNLSGKEVSPGLIAPLSQLGIVEIGLVPETRDDTSNIYSAGLSIDSAFNPSSTLIPYNLTGGVTLTLTSPSSSGLFSGMTSVFSLSGSLEESLVASNIALSANISGGEDSKAAKILLLEDSLDIASSMWRAWSPLPKNSYYSPRDLRAIKRVLKREIPLVVKANRASDILALIDLSKRKKIDLVIFGAAEGWRVAQQIASAKVPVIIQPIDNIPHSFNELGARLDNASLLHSEGVKILISSPETHNSYLSRQGAGIAVSYGLPWKEALKGLTKNISEVFKLNKRGAIQEGYIADIIIWDGDPLEVTSFVDGVYLSGKKYPVENRSMRLKERYLIK
tara:strand:- start:572 stop:1774 length:1203 start_codon:yes stop_codon:yes gene_type:complete